MTDGVFEADGNVFVPQAIGAGPWSSKALHGGPPAALVGRMLDRWGDSDGAWRLTRLSIEMLRPVPVAPLRIRVEPRRQGRRIQVLDAALHDAAGTEVLVARGLRVAVVDNGVDEDALPGPHRVAPPDPDHCERWSRDSGRPHGHSFSDAMEVRLIAGRPFDELGPAHVWLQLLTPILVGEDIHPLDRAIVAADYANGMSNVVPFTTHRYVNADLTLALHRYPTGEWISLDATTHARSDGHGTAHGMLSDRTQQVGHTIQSLVIDSR